MKKIIHILFYNVLILSLQLTFAQKTETTSTGTIPQMKSERIQTQLDSPCPIGEPFFHNPDDWWDEFDDFSNWTAVGPLGLTNWGTSSSNSAGGVAPELRMSWTPSFNGESRIRSVVFPLINNVVYIFSFRFFFDWYADPSGTITVGITYDGGTTSTILYSITDPTGNVGPLLASGFFTTPSFGSQNCQIDITFSGNSFNNDNIYWDDMFIAGCLSCYPPSAPNNLTSQVINNPGLQVQLNWQDNSWNENGFVIYRKLGYPNDPRDYLVIDTTQQNITQYTDVTVLSDSTYTYRVFAFNQYGQSGSNTTTLEVSIPVELISFTSEVDGNVVALLWNTATEINNSGFEIQRFQVSRIEELQGWKRIGFVTGMGTTIEIENYSFQDKPEPGKYKYRLKQIDFDGSFAYSPEIEAEVKVPLVFALEQNYPNPFNPNTKISWQSPIESWQTLKVYDILGNEIATLVDEYRPAGSYNIEFRIQNLELSSGIYFYQLKAGDYLETKKMILMK